ncbi:MAG: valine--tRNA ligase [Candidatus Melainabacteria bacterium RIFCSPLOWO2_02_FULL_35_15]|nr:MAG: valine--tRNA ligase [Candidatus Melainabacteria bacterium RIFCSPLOWO2_02_FULL_35_15]
MTELSKTYNPKEVEEKWLKIWLDEKLFKSKIEPDKENFSIALPPPNVTGSLHMGHAFGDTIQDVLIRYNKMNGKNVLWQGGTDHAGIATQVLVERDISKNEKKRKEDLGREEFLKRVWSWKERHGNEIINQMKKLGCMLDYDRLVFTMDENYTKAVRKVFVELFKKNIIYRGKRIVNWCPKCLTSISDLEVETEQIKGKLFHILYPFDIKNISKGGLTIATTRPETMFGDIAVAVNPNDGRYKKLIGTKVFLPFINKQIPIVGDEAIELDFGTGCLKVTPAHDATDYEIFERHRELGKYPEIMSPNGKITDKENIGIPADIQNLDRFKARELTVQKLEGLGLLKQIAEYEQASSKHDRCGTVIEPYLSEQWYVKMKPLAGPAIKAVSEGPAPRIRFTPERYKNHYLNWLKNIRDWCISRQLWWGHQIPVWYCENNHATADEETPKECIECKSKNLTQDPDVLDTWFSSALWPFVTLGWPESSVIASEAKQSHNSYNENEIASSSAKGGLLAMTSYFKTFYPTSVLATAREIINLWVSRMVFMGLEFAGNVPFGEVLIHPVIQTPDGKRMSKSKGNAIDPLDLIEKYGADANRFWYFSLGITGSQDVRFPGRKDKEGRWESDVLEQYKRFANKFWNASRFVMQNLEPNKTYEVKAIHELPLLTLADKWILHQYTNQINSYSELFNTYDFLEIARSSYKFIWDEFCDWYLEIAKRQLLEPELREQTQQILFYIIEGITRALHPIMPFITEEIWQSLPLVNKKEKYISLTSYPACDQNFSNIEAKSFSHVIDTTRTIRNLRQTVGIPWVNEIDVKLFTKNTQEKNILEHSVEYIEFLTKSKVSIFENFKPVKPSTGALIFDTRILIPISGLVDIDNMLSSLNKKKTLFKKEMENQKLKLNNANFINNAAQDKIDEVKTRVSELENQIKTINEQIELLK